jgi:tetratricopeptide (TPR) repeat protein
LSGRLAGIDVDGFLGSLFIYLFRFLFAEAFASWRDPVRISEEAEAYAASGNYPMADQKLSKLVKMAQREEGPAGMGVAPYLRRLGYLKIAQDDKAAAEAIFQRVLSIEERNLGPTSPYLVSTMYYIMQLSRERRDFDSAVAMAEKVLAFFAATEKREDSETAALHNRIGLLLREKGDLLPSVSAFRHALEIREKASDGDHLELALSLSNLAVLLQEAGQLEESESLHRRALSIRESASGKGNSSDLLTSLDSLADLLWTKGDLDGAKPLYQRSLEIRAKALGPDHVRTIATVRQLAKLLMQMGDLVASERLFQKAYPKSVSQTLGSDTPGHNFRIADHPGTKVGYFDFRRPL